MSITKPESSRRTFIATGQASGFALVTGVVPALGENRRNQQMETTICVDSEIATLINIFTVEPENQQKLVELLKEGTEAWINKRAGFISANFHRSNDGRRVIIYGQWRSVKDIEAMS